MKVINVLSEIWEKQFFRKFEGGFRVSFAGDLESLVTTEVERSARKSLRIFTSIIRKPKMGKLGGKMGRTIVSSANWMLYMVVVVAVAGVVVAVATIK
jgi:hypothetical protein